MIGTTREEMAAFYCIDKEIDAADQGAVDGRVRHDIRSGHQPYYDEIRRHARVAAPMRRCSAT